VSSRPTGGPTCTSPPAVTAASATGRPRSASRSRHVQRHRSLRVDLGDRGCAGPREVLRSRRRCLPRRVPPSTLGATPRPITQLPRGRHRARRRCGKALPPGPSPTSGREPPRRQSLRGKDASTLAPHRRAHVPGAHSQALGPSSLWRGSRPLPTLRCPPLDRRRPSERRAPHQLGPIPFRHPQAQGRHPRLFPLLSDRRLASGFAGIKLLGQG
jgi:hypothetical protein